MDKPAAAALAYRPRPLPAVYRRGLDRQGRDVMVGDPLAAGRARRPRPWLALACAALLLAACDSPEQKAAKAYERAVAYYEAGDDARAMVELRNVLRLQPKNAEAIYHVGLILERGEKYLDAYQAFQAAVGEKPDFVAAQYRYGRLALRGGEVEVAERAVQAIEQSAPESVDGLALRAALMLQQGDVQRAKELAQSVLERSPGQELAVGVVVGALRQRGRLDEAIAFLNAAIDADPKDLSSRLLRIALLEESGDKPAVIAAYGDLVALAPDNPDYRLALANFLQEGARLAEAEAVVREILARGLRSPKTVPALMDLVFRQHGFPGVEAEYARLIAASPDDHSLRLALADAYSQQGKSDLARATLEQVLTMAPDAPVANDARAQMAWLDLAAGDQTAAVKLADDVLSRDSRHQQANLLKGKVALSERQWDEAVRSARGALGADPGWLPGLRLMADIQLEKGERDAAAETLRQILRSSPTDLEAAGQLAGILARRGDRDAAIKIWDQVAETAPDATPALLARAALNTIGRNWLAAQLDIERLAQTPGQEAEAARLAGFMHLGQRSYPQAQEAFARAAELQPESWEATVGLVQAYLEAGDADRALSFLEARRAQMPDDALAYELIGEVLAGSGKAKEAEAALREAIRLRPTWSTPYRQLAALLTRAGDAAGVVAVHEAELAQRPGEPRLLLELGAAQISANQIEMALATYAEILEKLPDNDLAANNWSALVADHRYGRPQELQRALALAGRFQSSDNPSFLDTLGWLHFRNGDYPAAVALLDRAVALAPDRATYRYHFGMALERDGQKGRAAEELAKAISGAETYVGRDEAEATYRRLEAELSRPAPAGG